MAQGSPHRLPAHAALASQVKVPAGSHWPAGLQAFTTAVSAQRESPGAQTVHVWPHTFPWHGS